MNPTERLNYRPVTTEDAPFILELLTSPGWLKYIGDRGVTDLDSARNYIINNIIPAYQHPGCGPFLVIRKTDGAVMGNIGVYSRPGLDTPDFGFAFLPDYHGQGYAYEASLEGLKHASRNGHRELLAITLPINGPSLALLKKLGFVAEEELIRLKADDDELVLLRKTLSA